MYAQSIDAKWTEGQKGRITSQYEALWSILWYVVLSSRPSVHFEETYGNYSFPCWSLMQSIITDYDMGNQRIYTVDESFTTNLVSGDGENQASVRMQIIITDYRILFPVYFNHSLNCLISYGTFRLIWTGFWYFVGYITLPINFLVLLQHQHCVTINPLPSEFFFWDSLSLSTDS